MEKHHRFLSPCFFLNFSISSLLPQPKFSHLYLFLLPSQVLPVGKAASKQRFTQHVRTWKNTRLVRAQASFLWQCYTEDYCQTQHHIDQKSWGRAIRISRNYLCVGLIFFHCKGTFLFPFKIIISLQLTQGKCSNGLSKISCIEKEQQFSMCNKVYIQ